MGKKVSEAELFRSIFELSPIGIAICDAGGTVSSANRACLDIFGVSDIAEMKGYRLFDDPNMTEKTKQKLCSGETLRFEGSYDFEKVKERGLYRTSKSGTIYIDVLLTPLGARNKKPPQSCLIQVVDITKRRKVEEALQESERKYRMLVENCTEVIFSVDTDGNFTYISPGIERLAGYRVDEIVGTPFTRYIVPEDLPSSVEGFKRSLSGIYEPTEFRAIRKDGTIRHVRTTSKLIMQDNQPMGLIGIISDITDVKLATESLKASEKRYRLLAENVSDVIWTTDASLRVTYISPSVTALLGYSVEESMAGGIAQGLSAADIEILAADLTNALAKGGQPGETTKLTTREVPIRCKDGSTIWAEARAALVWGPDGQPAEVIGVLHDITRRKMVEEALRASEEKYRTLAEKSLQGIMIVQGWPPRIVYCNAAFANISGFTVEELLSMSSEQVINLVHPDDRDVMIKRYTDLLQGLTAESRHEFRAMRKDGSTVWLDFSASVIQYQGQPAIMATFVDITQRKVAEEALRESEEKYRTLAEESLQGIVIVQGLPRKIIYFNAAFANMIGFTAEELLSMSSEQRDNIIHPDDRETLLKRYADILQDLPVEPRHEFRTMRKDGSTVWLHFSASVIQYQGQPALMVTFVDITERKKAEQALKDSEEKFRTLIEKSTDAIVVLDATGTITYVSPSMEQVTGYRWEEWVGRPITEWLLHPDDRAVIPDTLKRLKTKPDVTERNIAVRYRHKDGSWHHIEAIARNLLHDTRVNGIVINFRDVTERVRAEEALKESEKRYRLLAENVSDVIWVTDLDLRPIYTSPSIERLLGYTTEEAGSYGMTGLLTPDSLKRASASLTHVLSLEKPEAQDAFGASPLTLEFKRKDGSSVWASTRATFLRDPEGRPYAILGVLHDVDELKRTLDLLKTSEERFRVVFESAPIGIILYDSAGNPFSLNATGAQIFGLSSGAGQKTVGIFADPYLPDSAKEALRQGKTLRWEGPMDLDKVREAGVYHVGRSGIIYLRVMMKALRDPTKESITGYVAIVEDITGRKEAEAREEKLQREIMLASRLSSLGQLASGVAHEINNPLTGVIGCSQLLLEKKDLPQSIKEDLQLISENAQRVAAIVKGLLTFARESKPGKRYEDINDILSRVLKLRAHDMGRHNIRVSTRFAPDLPRTMVDIGQMQQVFLNIILNAEQSMIKAHNGGHLEISTEQVDDIIRITFADDGLGIAKEDLPRIFDPFFTTKGVGEGTGLGLSISYGIVKEHQGKIYAEGEPGKGATFVVELPVVAMTDDGQELPKKPAEGPRRRVTGRILVVDDEAVICEMLTRLLTQDGHTVEAVQDAGTALEKVKRERFSLILLDIRLKGMSGIELYEQLGRIALSLQKRVIFITGDTLAPDTRDLLERTKAPYVTKPFDIQQLRDIVNQTLTKERT